VPSYPEPPLTDAQMEQMRREWLSYAEAVNQQAWSTEAEGSSPSEGTAFEPEQDTEQDSVPARRRRRPRGSYNRGLCIIRQRRAQAACHRSCPCRTAYTIPREGGRRATVETEAFGTLTRNEATLTWANSAGYEFTDEYVQALVASQRSRGYDEGEGEAAAREATELSFNEVLDLINSLQERDIPLPPEMAARMVWPEQEDE
jgi:hypothetical protein